MTDQRTYRLGDLQLRIMRVLWKYGSTSVAGVREKLDGDRLAYTTVATMLRKMEDRGLVGHRRDERRFFYEAAVSAEDVTRSMADDLVDRLFEGSLADAVSHLLETRDVGPQELARLERLVQERKKQRQPREPHSDHAP
ncbi:MAG: BlaI/MecI/CopY family transcriptional regulator [Planctomycetes bacterium]|nr:BlaI/MecI/CopY family transcriptional regulator [Planctomycetota bacterium]